MPTLVVHAVGDPLVAVEHGRFLAEHIDGARYVELPLAIHASTHAEDYEQLIDAWSTMCTGSAERVASERMLATRALHRHHRLDADRGRGSAISSGAGCSTATTPSRSVASTASADAMVKQTGDGMLATFDGPARGVQCAQHLSDTLAPLGLPIRAGLHTGEIETPRRRRRRDRRAHRRARRARSPSAGEVFVSRTVRDLVVGSDLHFEDRGTHELKGVPDPGSCTRR